MHKVECVNTFGSRENESSRIKHETEYAGMENKNFQIKGKHRMFSVFSFSYIHVS
jgi:hypothetical protein